MMRRILFGIAALLVVAAGAIVLVWPRAQFTPASSPQSWADTTENYERGAYLARAGNCMGCHVTRGTLNYTGGRALDTPFGRLYAPNITRDVQTGIGLWTADDFWNAMHNGISRDGRLLYPAFPYTNYTKMTRADSDALFAYLRSGPPMREPNRPHELRFPYNTQAALALWRLLYFRPGVHQDDPRQNADWNRGAYLVEGLGHCSACHSPRNSLGASGNRLSGGLIPVQGWYAPSLTSGQEAGLGSWDRAHIVQLLRTGVSPQSAVFGPMAEVVQQSLQHLTESDAGAMAAYLKSLPDEGGKRAAAAPPPEAVMKLGASLYERHCVDCHGADGRGALVGGKPAYPPLAGNRALTMEEPVNAIRIVLNGGFAPSTQGNPRPFGMPPYSHVLSDAEVAAVVSFVRASWGNQARPVTPNEVNDYRAVPLD
jgi:mono/diheme cytochrome c family protein